MNTSIFSQTVNGQTMFHSASMIVIPMDRHSYLQSQNTLSGVISVFSELTENLQKQKTYRKIIQFTWLPMNTSNTVRS